MSSNKSFSYQPIGVSPPTNATGFGLNSMGQQPASAALQESPSQYYDYSSNTSQKCVWFWKSWSAVRDYISEWADGVQERNQDVVINWQKWFVYFCGTLFAIGWWLFIDGLVVLSRSENRPPTAPLFEDWLPGIGGTIGLVMLNLISVGLLGFSGSSGFTFGVDDNVVWKARLWFFVSLVITLASLGGSIGIYAVKYNKDNSTDPTVTAEYSYFGKVILAENLLVFFSSLILWSTRNFVKSSEGALAI